MSTRTARKSKGVYGRWDKIAMTRAIDVVQAGKMGTKKAAKEFSVPKTTLIRGLKGCNKFAHGGSKILGRSTDLPRYIENELANHVKEMESRFYGLTLTDLHKLAFQIAKANNILTRFNNEKQVAGVDWLQGFLRRHPEISLRLPEATSLARASGFNKPQVKKFFKLLSVIQKENQLTAQSVYNMDETGINVIQKVPKILAKKGKSQVGLATSGERGQNVTVVCCMNAAGNYVSLAFIFPRVRMKPELQDGAPPLSMFTCQVN